MRNTLCETSHLFTAVPEPDMKMAMVKTDSSGRFSVSGSDSTTFTMKPALRIYHSCNNQGTLGLPNVGFAIFSQCIP